MKRSLFGSNGVFFDRWGNLRFGWCIVVGVVVLLAIGLTLGCAINAGNGASCERQGDARGVEARYGGWLDDTCYVTTDEGRILTIEQYDVKRAEVKVDLP